MKKDAPIAFRIPTDLKRDLVALAEAERRSVSSYIQLALEQHVKSAKSVKKTSPA